IHPPERILLHAQGLPYFLRQIFRHGSASSSCYEKGCQNRINCFILELGPRTVCPCQLTRVGNGWIFALFERRRWLFENARIGVYIVVVRFCARRHHKQLAYCYLAEGTSL